MLCVSCVCVIRKQFHNFKNIEFQRWKKTKRENIFEKKLMKFNIVANVAVPFQKRHTSCVFETVLLHLTKKKIQISYSAPLPYTTEGLNHNLPVSKFCICIRVNQTEIDYSSKNSFSFRFVYLVDFGPCSCWICEKIENMSQRKKINELWSCVSFRVLKQKIQRLLRFSVTQRLLFRSHFHAPIYSNHNFYTRKLSYRQISCFTAKIPMR